MVLSFDIFIQLAEVHADPDFAIAFWGTTGVHQSVGLSTLDMTPDSNILSNSPFFL